MWAFVFLKVCACRYVYTPVPGQRIADEQDSLCALRAAGAVRCKITRWYLVCALWTSANWGPCDLNFAQLLQMNPSPAYISNGSHGSSATAWFSSCLMIRLL